MKINIKKLPLVIFWRKNNLVLVVKNLMGVDFWN